MTDPLLNSQLPHPAGTLVPFGLEFIDDEIGGLIRDKLYLLYGPHSTLKSSIALHFLLESLRNDRRALYVTSQDPDALIVQGDRLGFNLRPYLRTGAFTLLNYLPRIGHQVALLTDYQRVMRELKRLCNEQDLDRIVFDPIEPLIGQDSRVNVLPATRLLIESLKSLNATTLCLIDETDDAHIQIVLKEFVFLAFGVFQLVTELDETRYLRFQKIIWNPREYPRLPLALRNAHGVQVLEVAPPPRMLTLASNHDVAEISDAPVSLPSTLNLLLVDNDDIYHEMLQDFLSERYRVERVTDSVAALSRLIEHSYDLILVNMNMPRVDGREVCLRIRQHQGSVPLLVFSNSHKRGTDIAGVLRIGADMFISRPFTFNQVKASIEAVLRRPASSQHFQQARELIKAMLEEQEALRHLPPLDPVTSLTASAYFEQRLRREVEKARIGEYSFSLASYQLILKSDDLDLEKLEPAIWPHIRPLARAEDMVLRYGPGFYLVFLDESLVAGVKRFTDRLKRVITAALGTSEFTLRTEIATYPLEGRAYDELLEVVLRPLRAPSSPVLKRVP